MTDDVPNEVARAAEGAFGARRDGTTLLDLQAETLSTLCFSDDDVTVDVILDRTDGMIDLQADARQIALMSIALDVAGTDGGIRRVGVATMFPARFLAVPTGLFSLVITLVDATQPDRSTAWCRLAH
jgi:hypothetical protein